MNKRIVYQNEDGKLAILIPAPNAIREGESEDQFLIRIAKVIPHGIYKIIDVADIPSDRAFRDAWEEKDRKIFVNMSKARAIHRNRLRGLRKPKLEALDVEALRAIEEDDKVALDVVKEKKQVLRDLPESFDLSEITNPDDLKKAIPKELKE